MARLSIKQKQDFCRRVEGEVHRRLILSGEHFSRNLCPKFGMTYSTFYNRCKKPESFTLGELLDIASYFNISLDVLLGIRK